MKTLLIDNYDSFTFNLYQMIAAVNGEEPIVFTNDGIDLPQLRKLDIDNIVISPGPGRPEVQRDFGICRQAILESQVPLLGVCLGHEGIGHLSGGTIVHAPEVMHGRLSPIYHTGDALFTGVPQGCMVVRYHSLIIAEELPDSLERTAWTDDGIIMGIRHRTRPIWGVQFHPESICTEHGATMLRNFRDITHRIGPSRVLVHDIGKHTMPLSGKERNGHHSNGQPDLRHADADGRTPLHTAEEGLADHHTFEVHSRRLAGTFDAEQTFVALFGTEHHAFWLDSSRVEEGLSRFSYMGAAGGPSGLHASYHSDTRDLAITEGGITWHRTRSIFDFLEEELGRRRACANDLPFDFNGGFVGYFGYELKGECGGELVHLSPVPDAAFILADRFIAFDHQEGSTYLVSLVPAGGAALAASWFDDIERRITNLPPLAPVSTGTWDGQVLLRLDRDHQTYLEDIDRCQEYITEGESYEICLTNQIRTESTLNPLDLYRTLRSVNPAPYAAFLRFGDLAVLCSSPERFLRVERDGWAESKPIKGTRPRGRDKEEDERIIEELRTCTKDRAENLMIVDLIRNDLGRVCEVGTVHVPALMHVESYATVHQLVSTIRGRLRTGATVIECVRAAFPGGSMTGAPKLRTMEIIDRLEGKARGIYSGSIGFLGVNGSADLNIVIRTLVVTPHSTSMGVGGAIVALSDSEEEFQETLVKAKAQIQAITTAATGAFAPDRYELLGTEAAIAAIR